MTDSLFVHMFNILQHREFNLRLNIWKFRQVKISFKKIKIFVVWSKYSTPYVKENQSVILPRICSQTHSGSYVRCSRTCDSVGKRGRWSVHATVSSAAPRLVIVSGEPGQLRVCPSLVHGTGLVFAAPTPFSRSKICDISAVSPHHGRFVTRPFTAERSCYFWPASTSL